MKIEISWGTMTPHNLSGWVYLLKKDGDKVVVHDAEWARRVLLLAPKVQPDPTAEYRAPRALEEERLRGAGAVRVTTKRAMVDGQFLVGSFGRAPIGMACLLVAVLLVAAAMTASVSRSSCMWWVALCAIPALAAAGVVGSLHEEGLHYKKKFEGRLLFVEQRLIHKEVEQLVAGESTEPTTVGPPRRSRVHFPV